ERYAPEGFGAPRGELRPEWSAIDEKVFLAAQPPQDFGREQRAVYERADLYLDATVQRVEAADGRARAVLLRTSGGHELRLRARAFVLATGGIENARLLLLSRLGNDRDQVGRGFMN